MSIKTLQPSWAQWCAFDPSTWETKAGGSLNGWSRPGLQSFSTVEAVTEKPSLEKTNKTQYHHLLKIKDKKVYFQKFHLWYTIWYLRVRVRTFECNLKFQTSLNISYHVISSPSKFLFLIYQYYRFTIKFIFTFKTKIFKFSALQHKYKVPFILLIQSY